MSDGNAENVELSARQKEVLKLMFEGESPSDVAGRLFVTKRTVDFHLYKIYRKLNVSNRIQAFRRAVELGLMSLKA